jgi:hypothetical protein
VNNFQFINFFVTEAVFASSLLFAKGNDLECRMVISNPFDMGSREGNGHLIVCIAKELLHAAGTAVGWVGY